MPGRRRPAAPRPALRRSSRRGRRGQVGPRRERRAQGLGRGRAFGARRPRPRGRADGRARLRRPHARRRGSRRARAPAERRARERLPPRDVQRRYEGGRAREVRSARRGARRHTARPGRDPSRHVGAVYRVDPRTVELAEMVRYATDVSREVAAAASAVKYNWISTLTQLSRELFASTEGALIDQAFALTQGACAVVAVAGQASLDLHDVLGHQRGWEILLEGVEDPWVRFPPFREFSVALAREAAELAAAPPLPSSDREVVVVTDPHYNTLVSHEIIGHPVELDRALKMETAYAGRSWLLRGLGEHQVGRQVASPLVTAYSDPSLPGYGHYTYDHEGTPARRVVHIDRGVFRGFMNSRQTAAIFGGEPNGHWKATGASLVPLIRMSNTVFDAGTRAPEDILGEVDHGWYVAGHRTPSIAESRENFRISARRVYEIRNGALGRLYRDGGIMADSRDYLMNVDAVGSDFRLYPIPNCGKGQPMQTKKLGNGGPTMRSRARLAGSTRPTAVPGP